MYIINIILNIKSFVFLFNIPRRSCFACIYRGCRNEITHHFAALWSAEHRPRKPDPGAVHGLCRDLGITPDRCALIGDANSDLRMARSAGVPVVLGYQAGWKKAPLLDPEFPHLQHWDELQVMAVEAGLGPGE